MSELSEFTALLEKIDSLLERYDPGELAPERIAGEILAERAAQRPILEEADRLATKGLVRYPFNAELLFRRAFARSHMVTAEGEFTGIASAVEDLETALKVDPDNLHAALDLLEVLFTFSAMEDSAVARIADELASRAEWLLLGFRALEVKALGYAQRYAESKAVYDRWIAKFPDSETLTMAKADADAMRGNSA